MPPSGPRLFLVVVLLPDRVLLRVVHLPITTSTTFNIHPRTTQRPPSSSSVLPFQPEPSHLGRVLLLLPTLFDPLTSHLLPIHPRLQPHTHPMSFQRKIKLLDLPVDAIVRVFGEDDFVGGGLEDEAKERGEVEELGASGVGRGLRLGLGEGERERGQRGGRMD
ncbi:hypothetical protein BDY24DRAFT_403578, partial [Mrakia frigida]|uniref:uncharacterized protein n=1 Tax=Mrakia frigida TaxID=29902 RepID=UPI003FCC0427